MSVTADQLVREFIDLVEVGPSGVYELRWIAQTLAHQPVPTTDPVLPAALTRVLALTKGRLAWVRWPDLAIQQEETRQVHELPSDVYADPQADSPLLAVLPAE